MVWPSTVAPSLPTDSLSSDEHREAATVPLSGRPSNSLRGSETAATKEGPSQGEPKTGLSKLRFGSGLRASLFTLALRAPPVEPGGQGWRFAKRDPQRRRLGTNGAEDGIRTRDLRFTNTAPRVRKCLQINLRAKNNRKPGQIPDRGHCRVRAGQFVIRLFSCRSVVRDFQSCATSGHALWITARRSCAP